MRILITGITGFAGSHLADLLLETPGVELFGLARSGQWPANASHLSRRVRLLSCDLGDQAALAELLRELHPDQIYHLAGYAHAGQSLREPFAAWAGNLTATLNLYEAVQRWGGKPRILFVGSGLIYGDVPVGSGGQNEEAVLKPANPYAASKSAADLASYQYSVSAGLDIIRARPFNHIGPRQSSQYALPHFARQIAAIEKGKQEPVLSTGDLSARRDFTDVRDMARAYTLLMERGKTGEAYNIGSGEARSIQSALDLLLRLTTTKITVEQRSDLLRASESRALCAACAKLREATGWKPNYSFEKTVTDILEYWRQSEPRA
jgi:GDP-4-dehydro-6-deoxy-D-mannose reductase